MKIQEFKNGAYVTFERQNCGLYAVTLRAPNGELSDKVRCDTYRGAMEYRRAFASIARGMK
jgi:hypothetical protein